MQVELFKKYLMDFNRVDSREVEDYSLWVYRFLTLKLWPGLSNQMKISAFMDSLALDVSLDEEQRSTAKNAVWTYLNDFLGEDSSSSAPQGRNDYLLLDTLRGFLQLKKYSANTVKVYVDWVNRYLSYCADHKTECDRADQVIAFLDYLDGELKVSTSTRNQALNALSFLFVNVFDSDLSTIKSSARKRNERQLPEVLSHAELKHLFALVDGTDKFMLQFIYGTGVTISEFCRMRVNALDFEGREISIFDDKNFDERVVPMPETLIESMKDHLEEIRQIHSDDMIRGHGAVNFTAMMKKKFPGQEKEWKWQYLFPSRKLTVDSGTGDVYRDRIAGRTVQSIMKKAVDNSGIERKISVHTLRHSFATHLLMSGVSFKDLQMLLGHKNIETTMIYNQILKNIYIKPVSPLDNLWS